MSLRRIFNYHSNGVVRAVSRVSQFEAHEPQKTFATSKVVGIEIHSPVYTHKVPQTEEIPLASRQQVARGHLAPRMRRCQHDEACYERRPSGVGGENLRIEPASI